MCVDAPRFRAGFASDEDMRAWIEEAQRRLEPHEAPSAADCELVMQQIADNIAMASACDFNFPRPLNQDHPLALPATEIQKGSAREKDQTPDFFMKAVRDMSGY